MMAQYNGFGMCDNHTYLFATEGKDCPYCEIERLKVELELSNMQRESWKSSSTRWCEKVDALERQLAEAKEREAVDSMRVHLFDEEVQCLRKQLAEARAYADRLADSLPEGMLPKDVELSIRAEARQEAVREILDIISVWYLPNDALTQGRKQLRERFGLEG